MLGTFEDDSFYYFTIARHIASGHGSTFDGIHATNGYHPLWCALLVPLMFVTRDHPEGAVRLGALVCVWLRFASSVLLFRLAVRAFSDRLAGAVAAITFFVVANGFSTNGMEEALQMFALMVLLTVVAREKPLTFGEHIWRGLLVALVILARLDMIFLAAAYFAHVWLSQPDRSRRERVHALAAEAIPCALAITAYLAWNAAQFDTVMPISGLLKNSTLPHLTLPPTYWSEASTGRRLLMLHALAVAIFLLVAGRIRGLRQLTGWNDEAAVAAFRIWAVGIVGFVAYQLLFGKWANWFSWYYQPLAFLGAIGLAQWLQTGARLLRSNAGSRRFAGSVLAFAAAALTVIMGASLARRHYVAGNDFQVASYHAGQWVAANTPEDTVLAMKDSGSFGFFSRRRVINLDGVTNNLAYQRALVDRGISSYLKDEGVSLVAQHSLRRSSAADREGDYDTMALEYRSNLYERSGGALQLPRASEVFRMPWVSADYGPNVFVIWRVGDQ